MQKLITLSSEGKFDIIESVLSRVTGKKVEIGAAKSKVAAVAEEKKASTQSFEIVKKP